MLHEGAQGLLSNAWSLTPAVLFHETPKPQLSLRNGCCSCPPARSPAASLTLRLWLASLCAAKACSLAAGLHFLERGCARIPVTLSWLQPRCVPQGKGKRMKVRLEPGGEWGQGKGLVPEHTSGTSQADLFLH